MAPSSQTRGRPTVAQQPLRALHFGGITKASKTNAQASINEKKLEVLGSHIIDKEKPVLKRTPKRRRGSDASEQGKEVVAIERTSQKKVKFQQPTPPSSPVLEAWPSSEPRSRRCTSPGQNTGTAAVELPEALQGLISLHGIFMRALTIHYAHHSYHTGAPLALLMPSMTRLWKKRTVQQSDLERMLAIWELHDTEERFTTPKMINHQRGPFRLITSGIGSNAQTSVEFSWFKKQSLNENDLQERYRVAIQSLYLAARAEKNAFVLGPIIEFPRLIPVVGHQTASKQEKIKTIREEILGGRAGLSARAGQNASSIAQPDLSKLSLSDGQGGSASGRDAALKARTMSLFDRVRAKQLAASSCPDNAATFMRRRAIARVPDIVNILRVKQHQKLSSQCSMSLFDSESNANLSSRLRHSMKVAFSFETLVTEIKDSFATPIGDEEVRECIKMLGRESTDPWCSVYDAGGVQCVTLQGEAKSGIEMQRELESVLATKESV